MSQIFKNPTTPITLDIGGTIFKTTWQTIERSEVLAAIVTNTEGIPFIDRNPKYFGYILDYLRDGRPIPEKAEHEAEFYCLNNYTILEKPKKPDIGQKLDKLGELVKAVEEQLAVANWHNKFSKKITCNQCWESVDIKEIVNERDRICQGCWIHSNW